MECFDQGSALLKFAQRGTMDPHYSIATGAKFLLKPGKNILSAVYQQPCFRIKQGCKPVKCIKKNDE